MSDAEFRALVRAMRALQKRWFRDRVRSDLPLCKDYERRVDMALAETDDGPGLFDEGVTHAE